MADVSIKYKGVEKATLNESGSKTIKTGGKYCEGDILVAYEKPKEPSGTKTIMDNGTYDVADFALAEVNVPLPNFYVAKVTIPTHISTDVTLFTMPDHVYAHINDDSFWVCLECTEFANLLIYDDYFFFADNNPNNPLEGSYPVYGVFSRKIGETSIQSPHAYYPPKETNNATGLGSSKVWHNGNVLMYKSGGYFLGAGTYKVMCGW